MPHGVWVFRLDAASAGSAPRVIPYASAPAPPVKVARSILRRVCPTLIPPSIMRTTRPRATARSRERRNSVRAGSGTCGRVGGLRGRLLGGLLGLLEQAEACRRRAE